MTLQILASINLKFSFINKNVKRHEKKNRNTAQNSLLELSK